MKRFAVLAVLFCACGGSDRGGGGGDKSFCSIGNLQGIWGIHYLETNGTCGPLPDQRAGAGRPVPYNCTVHSAPISADRCSIEVDASCPTIDGRGMQDWVITMRQTSYTRLEGRGALQITGVCASSYDMTMDKI